MADPDTKRLQRLVVEIGRLSILASVADWSDPHRARLIRREVERLRISAYHLARWLGRDDYADTLSPSSRPSQAVATDGDPAPSCAPVAGPPISQVAQ